MLTPEQTEQFQSNGFIVVDDLLSQTALNAVRQEYSNLMDQHYSVWASEGKVPSLPANATFWEKLEQCYRGGFDWYQPFDICLPHSGISEETPMHFGPAVFDMATHPRILDAVEQLIGPEISSNPIQHVRIKPPEREVQPDEVRAHVVATDWHQDLGVTLEEADETQFVTVWLAITDATLENGCLQVDAGKYREMLPHCATTQLAIPDQFLSDEAPIPTPVKAGGAVIFHPLTPHCSLSNTSDQFRWSFDLRYHVTGQASGRSQFPEFIARSRSNPQSELIDWRKWKAAWEEARLRLAHAPPIDQHRWSNDAPYCA